MEKQVHEELKSLYGWSVEELSEFKGRQWQAVNYVFLLYGGLGAIPLALAHAGVVVKGFGWVVVVLGAIVMVSGLVLQSRLEEAMELRRTRMKRIREDYFSAEFRKAWEPPNEKGGDKTPWIFPFMIVSGWLMLLSFVWVGGLW